MPGGPISQLFDRAGQRQAWSSLAAALQTTLLEPQTITGASGLEHPVQALRLMRRVAD